MNNWKQITFIFGLAILAIMIITCTKQQSTVSETAVITSAETYAEILTGDLSASAEGAAEKNNENYSFIHTPGNPINIWGWSRDGIVGISELKDTENRGGTKIGAFVLNTVSDAILWEQEIDSFNFDDGYSDIPENEINAFFNNFHNICTQQFGINIQGGKSLVPSDAEIRHNGKTFNVIINADIEEDNWITRYSAIVETGGKRKTILSKDTFLPFLPVFYRYNVSPFEERALIIIRWASLSHTYGFEYAGCHLVAGFE